MSETFSIIAADGRVVRVSVERTADGRTRLVQQPAATLGGTPTEQKRV